MSENKQIDKNVVVSEGSTAELCQRYHIHKLAFFGSVFRDDFRPDSDIDILVEFKPGHTPGFAFFSIEAEFSEMLGRKVELHTENFLSRYFRSEAIQEAEIKYRARS